MGNVNTSAAGATQADRLKKILEGTVAPAPCSTNVCVRELNAHGRKMRVDAACGNSEGPQKHGFVPVKRSRFKLDRVNSLILASTFCFTFRLFTSARRRAGAMKYPNFRQFFKYLHFFIFIFTVKESPSQPQLLNLCFLLLLFTFFLMSHRTLPPTFCNAGCCQASPTARLRSDRYLITLTASDLLLFLLLRVDY